jgi:hypothetical protein
MAMKCCPAINFTKWFSSILIPYILSAYIFANIEPVAEVIGVTGEVNIKPSAMDIIAGFAITGRSIYNGDILRSTLDSQLIFQFTEADIRVTTSGLSEIRIDCGYKSCQIKLNYGNLFIENSHGSDINFSILTKYSEIFLNDNEVWMTRSMAGKDEIYSIKGTTTIYPVGSVEQHIEIGEKLSLENNGEISIEMITQNMLPEHIYERLDRNHNLREQKPPFTVMNYFTDDSTIAMAFYKEEIKIKHFRFSIETGAAVIENSQYGQVSILPIYTGKHLKFGYKINGFISLSDTSKSLNTFSSLSQILSPLILDYISPRDRFNLKLGRLYNLTFGYGMLLNRYTNTVSYPIMKDGGLAFDYKSDAENFTLKIFTSSIDELSQGGGLTGIYSTTVMKALQPLRMGVGIVYDNNQFGSVSDSIWSGVSPRKRTISGYQVDITYELKSGLLNNTYLFGEFITLNYPMDLRYIRNQSVNGVITEEGFGRKSSFGILGPGIHWKLGHFRDVKIAFIYSSPLHMVPFFGETYNLERVHYIPSSILDSIDNNEPYSLDGQWNTMIKENYIDADSNAYYLPKDVYALLDPTRNVYNKIGLLVQYDYKFRSYYEYSFDISVLQESGNVTSGTSYYTLGMNFFIHEGLIQGISECALYFNQYFTTKPFNTSTNNENTVFGARLGIKLLQNVSLRIYRHDVFYDNNLDGNVDLNSTMGLGVLAKF